MLLVVIIDSEAQSIFSSLQCKMVRATLVTTISLALTGTVIAHAYFLKHQFYPTVVYLTKSSPSMAVSRHWFIQYQMLMERQVKD